MWIKIKFVFSIICEFALVLFLVYAFILCTNWYKNYKNKEFAFSEKMEKMVKIANNVSNKFCHESGLKQQGFNDDQEHVDIICRDGSEVEIRIKGE